MKIEDVNAVVEEAVDLAYHPIFLPDKYILNYIPPFCFSQVYTKVYIACFLKIL